MALQKKKDECLRKVQNIVEILIDGTDDEDYFLDQLRWISDTHYIDITEERAIVKICGYPLCHQKLVNVPKKKYHISMIQNKVYDITERKLFCSNQCFKASSFLKGQLLTSPLWTRDKEQVPHFSLFKCSTELLGDEVRFDVERVTIPEDEREISKKSTDKILENEEKSNSNDDIEVLQSPNMRCETKKIQDCVEKQQEKKPQHTKSEYSANKMNELPRNEITKKIEIDSRLPEQDRSEKSEARTSISQPSPLEPMKQTSFENETQPKVNSIVKVKVVSMNASNSAHQKPERYLKKFSTDADQGFIKNSADFVLHIEKSLREWMTMDSLVHIIGYEAVKRLMLEKGKTFDASDFCRSDKKLYERYAAICKRLKFLGVEDEKYQKDLTTYDIPSKPLPDYEALKEQTEEMVIKVRSFYMGDKKVTFSDDVSSNQPDENDRPNVLPPLHQYAKNSIRRNIVLDKLKIVLPDLTALLGITYIQIDEKIKKLTMTYKFSAHNITFKPLEWNLIGLILLKLLSLKDESLSDQFLQKSNYINAMLMSYQLENNYLDLLCTWLTDINQILKNDEP